MVVLSSFNNNSTRYAANLQTPKTPDSVITHGMLHMMFKLGKCAEENWRKLRGFDYLAKVITGVKFKDGIETTETGQIAA